MSPPCEMGRRGLGEADGSAWGGEDSGSDHHRAGFGGAAPASRH